jgi:hypothetical protein
MDLLDRVKAILATPTSEWLAIAREAGAGSGLIVRYLAVLALIPAVARLVGASLVGGYAPFSSSLTGALASWLASIVMVPVLALIIDTLAPVFAAQKNFAAALKLAVYSATPVWLAGVVLIVPGLSFLMLLGFYGAYLMQAGLPAMMKAPAEKTPGYAAVVVASALLLAVGVGSLTAPLFAAVNTPTGAPGG